MSHYVRLSIVAPRAPTAAGPLGQADVDRMVALWRAELAQVTPDHPDLIVLPEACDRYAGPSAAQQQDYYRLRGDQLLDLFRETARRQRCHIAYSAIRALDDGTWRNTTQLIGRDGEIVGLYNKTHTTIGETEENGILCGREAPIIECDLGRVACAICFDLNFHDLRLQYAAAHPDLILFSSMYHGGLMQAYWAYSCRAHFVASVAGLPSAIVSPVGHTLATTTNYMDYVTTSVNLDCRVVHLDYNWPRLNALKAKYGPGVTLFDPGHLASVLVTSELEGIPVDEMLREFEIELLDDYLARSLAHHHNPTHIEPPTDEEPQ